MYFLKEIEAEIGEVRSLKDLTQIYGEIAAARMKKIRGVVISNRDYLAAIRSIFEEVLAAYVRSSNKLLRKDIKDKRVTFLSHNGKTVSVFFSANTGFFGNVIQETFNKFIADIRQENSEVTIIGRIGRGLFLEAEPTRSYVYFDLPDFGIDQDKLSQVVKHLVQYSVIKLYFGRFQSVVTQKPYVETISEGVSMQKDLPQSKNYYIIEPSIEDVLIFFETQMFISILDQSIRESQLAKFASRILAMDSASQNIDKRILELKRRKLNVLHKSLNEKQLNSLSPVVFAKIL
jgi:F-type H+-transporting ATPase subunit gamma